MSNQSGEVTHTSICLTNCRRSFFFQLPSIYLFSVTLFRAWSYDNQFSKIKFNLLKILEASQEHTRAILVKLQAFIPQFNQFHPRMLLSNSISRRLLLNLYIMSHRGNYLSVLYDKIPIFYALKYTKFTAITFYQSAWRPNPLLTLPNCTTSFWSHAHFTDIFTHVTTSGTNMR